MNVSRTRVLALALTLFLYRVTVSVAADNVLPRDSDYDYDPPVPGSYTLPVVKVAPDGAIIDSAGRSLNLRDLTHGRITVLSFIYTRCAAPKACPYATGVLTQLHALSEDDKALAKNMRLVSMSFDPDYDTPQRLATYSEAMREEKTGCEWRFATAKSRAELNSILDAYGQAVDTRPNPLIRRDRAFTISCASFSSIVKAASGISTAPARSTLHLSSPTENFAA
jgi:cytochrome oxidase Cu insertion factor (SCO1/SenC/PrrC family)